VEVYLFQ